MIRSALITGIICSAVFFSGCGGKIEPGGQTVQRAEVEGVTAETVALSMSRDFHEKPGTIISKNTSMVSSKLMGVVSDIPVKPGQKVKKGDILLRIDSPDIDAKVRAAGEAVEEAGRGLIMAEKNKTLMEKTYGRYEKLYEGKAVTEQQFDEIQTRRDLAGLEYEMAGRALKRAEAGLQEAEAFMAYSVIRSPLDGIVAERKIDVGSMAAPSMPLFVIEAPEYRVEAPVNESLTGKITPGMKVEIHIETLKAHTVGEIIEVQHRIDPATRTFPVKIDLPDEGLPLRGGLYCTVRFPLGEKSQLLVPAGALVERGQLRGVFTVDGEGVMSLRFIRTGEERQGMVEVLSGLKSGEKIIIHGVDKAVDGGIMK